MTIRLLCGRKGGMKMNTSTESLFLEAISAGIRGKRVHWAPLPPEQWTALFRLAETQKLLAILTDAVFECPNADSDPGFSAYRSAAKRQVQLQTLKDAAFLPIYLRLREAGIPALLVKGLLCRSVYPNGALRVSADEDLLVESACFPDACRLLAEAGLIPGSDEDPRLAAEISWRSADGLRYIELHKYLFAPDSGPFGLFQTVLSEVFAHTREYRLGDGASILSLSPHDHLLYLLLHAMKHFIRTGFGLRQICDIGLWADRWRAEINWELLWEQAERVQGAQFCAALFRIAESSLGIPLDLPALWRSNVPDLQPMLRDLLDGGIYGSSSKSREHSARITQDAVAAQRRGKRQSLRTAIFPSAKSLERDFPVLKEHPLMLPLIWEKRLAQYLRSSASDPSDDPSESLRLGRERLSLLREYGILE